MNKTAILVTMLTLLLAAVTVLAQVQDDPQAPGHGVCRFIDENGDGFNDLAPDDDGDGIPNGMDPDWQPPADGTGHQHQFRAGPYGYGPMAAQYCFGSEMANSEWSHMAQHMGDGDHAGMIGMGPGGGMMGFGPGTGTGDHEGVGQPGTGWMDHRGDMHGGGHH